MARKLSDIALEVRNSQEQFLDYLRENLNAEIYKSLNDLGSRCNVYIFSGVIRNFFLDSTEKIRDLDLVVDCDRDVREVFKNYRIKHNSFGGYKIEVNGLDIDLWRIKDTWMYSKFERVLEFDLSLFRDIPNTAFFNFSSILFDFNNKTFIYKTDFLRFLRDRELDVVNEFNPNYELCIVNSLYYSDRYKLSIGDNLKRLIVSKHFDISDYSSVQIKHFGEIKYNHNEIIDRIKNIWLSY